MTFPFPKLVRAFAISCLIFTLASSQLLQAQSSVVQRSELRDALKKAAINRQKNLDQVKSFFESEPVRKIMSESHFDSSQIQKGIAALDANELANLAAKVQKAKNDFAAGSLTNEQLTYIVIALATAVVVIIIFKA